MKLTFCMQINTKVDFSTLGIKGSYNMILSLLMGMIKYSQSTQSNKFAISLQYLRKEVKDRVHILHEDKHQSFTSWQYHFRWKWPNTSKVPKIGSW